jgi:hypothetical protein
MILSRCHSPITTTWSRHSRRIEPITRSAYAFCHGERGAMTTSRTSNTSWLDAKIVRYSSARLLVASGDPRPWRALRRDMPGHRRSRRRAGEPPQRAAAGGKWPCACRSEASRRRHGFIESGPIGHSGLIRSENLPSPYGPSRPVLPERRRSSKLAPKKGRCSNCFETPPSSSEPLDGRVAKFGRGRTDRCSSLCSTPPRSHAQTVPSSPLARKTRRGLGARNSSRKPGRRPCRST